MRLSLYIWLTSLSSSGFVKNLLFLNFCFYNIYYLFKNIFLEEYSIEIDEREIRFEIAKRAKPRPPTPGEYLG